MGISKEKIKSLKSITSKLKKHSFNGEKMDMKKFINDFDKEYFSSKRKGSTKGLYKTPDGKPFKGKFNNTNKKTFEAKPIKIKGKFSKVQNLEFNQSINLKPKSNVDKKKLNIRDYGNQAPNPPAGEEGPGGGSGGGGL